jgi:hypothetical protein
MVFNHEELLRSVGLRHGTGAICCGCPIVIASIAILRNIMNENT